VILPTVAVFLFDGGAAARHEDFVRRPEDARFVARDVVGSVREEHPGVTEIAIVGLSLSGLAAAYGRRAAQRCSGRRSASRRRSGGSGVGSPRSYRR
jgi:hypothetical protein